MDLFAYFARYIIMSHKPENAIFSDENFADVSENMRFYIYAYMKTKEQAIGLEFWDKLTELCRFLRVGDKFRFDLRLSNPDYKRIDFEDVKDMINHWGKNQIDKLYVWGTPSLNEFFERNFEKIRNEAGVEKHDFWIL